MAEELDSLQSDLANLLESLEGDGGGDDDGSDGGEFSMAELDELMNLHGVQKGGEGGE